MEKRPDSPIDNNRKHNSGDDADNHCERSWYTPNAVQVMAAEGGDHTH